MERPLFPPCLLLLSSNSSSFRILSKGYMTRASSSSLPLPLFGLHHSGQSPWLPNLALWLPLLQSRTCSLLLSQQGVLCSFSSLVHFISCSCCCFILGSQSSATLYTSPLYLEGPASLINSSPKISSLGSNDAPPSDSFRLILGSLLNFLYSIQTSIQSDITAVFLSVSHLSLSSLMAERVASSLGPACYLQYSGSR